MDGPSRPFQCHIIVQRSTFTLRGERPNTIDRLQSNVFFNLKARGLTIIA